MAESKPSSHKLEPHPLVAALQSDPSKPPARTLKLVGFPGKSPEAGTSRLWLDSDLVNYVDIPDASIRHTQTLANNGGTVVWIDADARISHGSTRTTTPEEFLSGGIAGAHLPSAAAGAPSGIGAAHPNAITLTVPCVTHAPPCPTFSICPSHLTPCNSIQVPCVTHAVPCPITVGPQCPPSHLTPCASHQVPCITHNPPCVSVAIPCPPSHLTPCASHQIPCITHNPPCVSVAIPCPPSHLTPCGSHIVACIPSIIACPTHTVVCTPTALCPSHIACPSLPACPSAICPSLGCGGGNPGEGTL